MTRRATRRLRASGAIAALGVAVAFAAFGLVAAQPGGLAPRRASAVGEAPAITFRHLTSEQGLPNDDVTAVTQDAIGFLWIGTTGGLVRYDGAEMRTFARGSAATSVTRGEIRALAAGRDGTVWVGTSAGLSRYDAATEAFTAITGLPSVDVNALVADTAGGVWIGTAAGIARVEPGETAAAPARAAPARTATEALAFDGTTLWAGTDDGLLRLDVASNRARLFRRDSAGTEARISALAISERGSVLVGTEGAGLFAFDARRQRFTGIDTGGDVAGRDVLSVHEDSDGTVWVGTRGGGLRQLTPGASVTVHRATPGTPSTLAGDHVSHVFEDRQGVLWAATSGNGLDRFDRASDTVVHLRASASDPASLASDDVRAALVSADGILYVGTDRSLDRSRDGRTFDHTLAPAGQAVTALIEARNGQVWAGTDGAGVFRVAGGALEGAGGLGSLRVSALSETRDGALWVGTESDGIVRYDVGSEEATAIRNAPGAPRRLASNAVRALAQTSDGAFWVATAAGLCRADRPGRAFECPGSGNALPDDDMHALRPARDGILWAGGRAGLYRISPDGRVQRFTPESSDLPGASVLAITEGDPGRLWISTEGGITELEPVTGVFSNRSSAAMGADLSLGSAAARAPDGRLYLGGADGLLAFYPRSLATENPNPPQVAITRVDVFGEAVVPGAEAPLVVAAPVAERLDLAYDQDYVTFRFAALHFADPADNRARFRLDGFDDDWRDAARRREATYTNLDPGTYTFRVQASNADGVWSEPGAALSVVIHPPWWRTPWAMLAFAGIAVAGLVRGERWQKARLLRQEREKAEKREAVLRAETAEAERREAEAELERTREVQEANEKLEAANAQLEASLADLRATQAQLVQSEKLASLGQLTAGIAHEIKNPLNFVNNFADLSVELVKELREDMDAAGDRPTAETLADLGPTLDDLRDNSRRIHEHGQRADRIVRAMLLHSRGGRVDRARVDINAFVEEYANLAYHGARANDADLIVDLVRDYADDAAEAEVVPQELGRVLINLLTNAFHAVRDRQHAGEPDYTPQVTVRTRREARASAGASAYIVVEVVDNGPGIPDAVRERIFEPFYTTKPTGEGTGLGLSLAHDIVTQVHGGTLAVESEVGTGARFTIRFPADAPQSASA